MAKFENPFETIETRLVIPTKSGNQFTYVGAESQAGLVEPENAHPKSTVDARPYVQKAAYKTYWWDPNQLGRSAETIYYVVNQAPTKQTPGTKYTQVIYYRFTVGTGSTMKTFQFKKTIYWLKNVEGSSPAEPWFPSSDITDEIYEVRNTALGLKLFSQSGQQFDLVPII